MAEDQPPEGIAPDVALGPVDVRAEELSQIRLVVDAVPYELHVVREVVLGDERGEVVRPPAHGARGGHPS